MEGAGIAQGSGVVFSSRASRFISRASAKVLGVHVVFYDVHVARQLDVGAQRVALVGLSCDRNFREKSMVMTEKNPFVMTRSYLWVSFNKLEA